MKPTRYHLFVTALLSISFWTCQKDSKTLTDTPSVQADKKWSNGEIDAFIFKTIKEKDQVFDWRDASDDMLWSALTNSDNLLAVGFKPATAIQEEGLTQNARNNGDWKAAKNAVVQSILASESRANPSVDYKKFEIGSDFDHLNAFYIRVTGFETIQKLRQSPLIRYVYPVGYAPQDPSVKLRSDSGCDGYVGETLYSPSDYTTITPNAKQSWTYSFSQISSAWARTTGAGIGVMVIDAGVSSAQAMFQASNFASGASSGYRTVELISRYPSQTNFWGTQVISYDPSPYSSCGHGTTMCGIVSSPRNALGASVGVAYNCNLVSCRAVEDVLISNSKEELGVAAALNLAASRADIRIVSMSLGSITTRSVIGDAIKNMRNNGKLPFCAAGTSTSFTTWYGVVYPASMAEAIAVTGVTNSYQKCSVCHSGSAVDFTAVMDRDSDGKSVVTLAISGYQPATVGGSSAATATVAGIAALVWGRNTSQTSAQVLTRLRTNSQYAASVNGQFGYGVINANNATNF